MSDQACLPSNMGPIPLGDMHKPLPQARFYTPPGARAGGAGGHGLGYSPPQTSTPPMSRGHPEHLLLPQLCSPAGQVWGSLDDTWLA